MAHKEGSKNTLHPESVKPEALLGPETPEPSDPQAANRTL